MFPKAPITYSDTRGFLIPLSAIIVVGISILAIAISDMSSQSSQASVTEGVSVQAFYAAESGAYYGMNQLIFDVTDRAIADVNCAAVNGDTINFTTNGLQSCSANIFCILSTVTGNPQSFYTIRSEATCGSGSLISERIVEVSSFL